MKINKIYEKYNKFNKIDKNDLWENSNLATNTWETHTWFKFTNKRSLASDMSYMYVCWAL